MQPKHSRKRQDSSSSEYSSSSSYGSSANAANAPVDDGEETQSYQSDDEAPPHTPPPESRGKKGLTHEEMARYRDDVQANVFGSDADADADAATQSESEQDEQPEQPDEWKDPIVEAASALLEDRGLETDSIGYARLQSAGKGAVDYLVRLQSVTIGRIGYGCDCELKSEGRVVSRKHARLFWDEKSDRWLIACLSKNGLLVDGTPVVPAATPMPLTSRSLIEIGDVAFFFLLACESTFRVNDISLLERNIFARKSNDEYSDDDMYHESAADEYSGLRGSAMGRGRGKGRRPSTGGTRHSLSSKMGRRDMGSAKKGKGKGSGKKGRLRPDSDFSSSDSETEEEEEVIPDILDDIKYRPMLVPLPASNGKRKHGTERSEGKKRRKKGRSHAESSGDEYEDAVEHDSWSKKEKGDFARALFAVGVDPVYDEDGRLLHFAWERFRKIAELPNKSDYDLEEYYRRFMTDVHGLLEEEEREKRTKGPRTKHKKGCDCIVCINTAKSRERKKGIQFEERPSEDDRESKSTGKPNDRLVGLVTAQKLRVRMGIHEAALQFHLESPPAVAVHSRLNDMRGTTELKDFPKWWILGYHDKTFMKGVYKHGVGQWDNIWYDDSLMRFLRIREKDGAMAIWPSQQAAMKRVRDISSMVISEMKKIAKKEREMRRYARRKARRYARQQANLGRQKKRVDSGDEYEEVPEQRRQEDVSTAEESGSERRPAAEVETEDEEDVEVEVEEMEVEEAADEPEAQKQASKGMEMFTADASTDDETAETSSPYNRPEHRGYYEEAAPLSTASESESE